jgi:hypothetical protein
MILKLRLLFFLTVLLITSSSLNAISWETKTPMSTPRSFLGIVAIDEKIYAIGGRNEGGTLATMEIYDTTSNSWSPGASMPTTRREFGIGVIQGKIYVVGGYDGSSVLSSVLEYDPSGNTWTAKSPLPSPREGLSVAVVNDTLYAIGGDDGSATVNTVEAYDPIGNSWVSRASMSTARTLLTCEAFCGKIYAMGGNDAGVNATGVVEVFDPASNSWSSKASLMPRYGLSSAVVDDKIYALGGFIGMAVVGVVQSYDTTSNSWSGEVQLPTTRWGLDSDAIGNKMYAVGGQTLYHGGYVAVNEVATVEITGISLSYFSVLPQKSSLVVSWCVESEPFALYYILKRRENEGTFRQIARIEAGGMSPHARTYNYRDTDVKPAVGYSYKLGAVDYQGSTVWFGPVFGSIGDALPPRIQLLCGNPCGGTVRFGITLTESRQITVTIGDASGRIIATIAEGIFSRGYHTFQWNPQGARNHIYYIRVQSQADIYTQKIVLIQ